MAEYTFFATFSEFTPLYRGIVDAWIGGQSGHENDEPGVLYAKYETGDVQEIGPVSDYYEAKINGGFEGSFEEWIEFMQATKDHVINAEKWAIGKVNSQDGDTYEDGSNNSSKDWAGQSKKWATSTTVVSDNLKGAKGYANDAKTWATSLTVVSDDLKGAKGYATDASDSAALARTWATSTTVVADSLKGAKGYANDAKTWATSTTVVSDNLKGAKGYANDASSSAALAKDWAISSSKVEGDLDSAKTYASNAKTQADRAAVWAVGSSSGNGSANNNSKHWAEQSKSYADGKGLDDATVIRSNSAKDWATSTTVVESSLKGAKGYATESQEHADQSKEYKLQSESFAKGTRNGAADTIRTGAADDNAKAYKDLAKDWATSSSKVEGNLDSSKTYAGNAKTEADRAAVWAVGSSSGDGDANNNSKYWAEQSKSYSDGKNLDDTITIRGTDNAEYYKELAKSWASKNKSAGTVDDTYYSARAYALDASDIYTQVDQARTDVNQAAIEAYDAREKAQAYASGEIGIIDPQPVQPGQPGYQDNSKYYMQEAQRIVNEEAANLAIAQQWANGTTSEQYVQGKDAKSQALISQQWANASHQQANKSETSALKSEGFAVGEQDGTEVQSGTYFENNAKYYSGAAQTATVESGQFASDSRDHKLDSEAWAVGKKDGTDIPSTHDAYHNNSKYWADNAAESVVTISGISDIVAENAQHAHTYEESAAMWATGDTEGTPSATYNSKYFAEYMDGKIEELGTFFDSAETEYAHSGIGTTPPSTGWTSQPNPVKGEFLWAKTTFHLTGDLPDYIMYDVGYVGIDGDNIPTITNEQIDTIFA